MTRRALTRGRLCAPVVRTKPLQKLHSARSRTCGTRLSSARYALPWRPHTEHSQGGRQCSCEGGTLRGLRPREQRVPQMRATSQRSWRQPRRDDGTVVVKVQMVGMSAPGRAVKGRTPLCLPARPPDHHRVTSLRRLVRGAVQHLTVGILSRFVSQRMPHAGGYRSGAGTTAGGRQISRRRRGEVVPCRLPAAPVRL